MSLLNTLVLTVHIIAGLAIIVLVLLQHGKGADMGAAFGGGASGSLFGATGSANFLSRATGVTAAIFFLTSLSLSYIANVRPETPSSVMDSVPTPSAPAVPVPTPEAPNSKAKDIPK
jgi:preprotein translocase subunit SecG